MQGQGLAPGVGAGGDAVADGGTEELLESVGGFEVEGGGLVVANQQTLPYRSDDRRIGFAIRFVPTHVRQVVGRRDSAMLVRGVDAYRHFESEPRPSADFEPAQLALQAEIERRRSDVLFQDVESPGPG